MNGPLAFDADFDDWTQTHLGVWFDTQVTTDAVGVERLEAGVRGERLPLADPGARRMVAALVMAESAAVVASAVTRMFHRFASPAVALGDADVAARIDAFLATNPNLDRPADSPTRAEFEALATA